MLDEVPSQKEKDSSNPCPPNELEQAQLQLIRAQVRKASAEATESEKRLNSPWFRNPENVKLLVVVLASSGLLAIWVVQFFEPILTAKQQLSAVEVQIAERRTAVQQLENAEIRRTLEGQIARLQGQQNEQRETIETIQAERRRLTLEYAALAKQQQLTARERSEYLARAERFEKDSRLLQGELERLKRHQVQTDALAADVASDSSVGSMPIGGSGKSVTPIGGTGKSVKPTVQAISGPGVARDPVPGEPPRLVQEISSGPYKLSVKSEVSRIGDAWQYSYEIVNMGDRSATVAWRGIMQINSLGPRGSLRTSFSSRANPVVQESEISVGGSPGEMHVQRVQIIARGPGGD